MKYRLLTLLVLSAGFSGSVIGDDDIERIEVKGHRILDFKPGFVSFNLGHGFPIATKYGRYEPRDRGDRPKSRGGLNKKQCLRAKRNAQNLLNECNNISSFSGGVIGVACGVPFVYVGVAISTTFIGAPMGTVVGSTGVGICTFYGNYKANQSKHGCRVINTKRLIKLYDQGCK